MLGHQQRCMRCMVDRMAYGLSVCQLQVIKRQPVLHLEFAHRGIWGFMNIRWCLVVWLDICMEDRLLFLETHLFGGKTRHLHLHKTIQDRSTNYHFDYHDVHEASDYHSTRSTWASGCLFSQIKISSWLIKAKADKLQMCGLHNGFMMIMMIHVQDSKNHGESPITIILVHPSKWRQLQNAMTTMISASRRRPWLFKSGVMSVTPGATQVENDCGGPMNHPWCQKSDLQGASLNRYRQMFVEWSSKRATPG